MIRLPAHAARAIARLEAAGFETWAVGGCVRDSLRGAAPHDWDLCTAAHPGQMQAVFAGERVLETGVKHGTLTLLTEGGPLEITTFRADGGYSDGRHPDGVRFVGHVEDDLARRDFTVGAMAWHPERGLCDPFGGLDDLQEEAENELEDTYASTEKQLENTANGIVVGAQTAYAGIITIREGIETLDRSLAALDRNIAVVEKQVEIGMASQLTLENLEQTRRTAAAQRETLVKQQTATENQLSLLCGNTANTTVKPTTLPTVTDRQLADMNYEKDLEAALDNSYTIWSARDEMRKASNDYEDNVTSTVDAYEAAKLNLEYAEESVTNSFRQLYLDVQDKKRLLDEAQAAYDMEKKNFDVDALRYERGMISKNDYLTAQDDLAAQEDAVRTAEHDLFTAYNAYDWAKRGYIGSAA